MIRIVLIFASVLALVSAESGATPTLRQPVATMPTATTVPPAEASCTLVELQPGYPGYRGFVTGLYGPGEAACLEDLTRLYPWFDRDHEDAENVAAGYRLGLAGGRSSWVWENWLAIEAERGFVPTCYLEAYREMQTTPFQQARLAPTDRRLRIGAMDSKDLIERAATAAGVTPRSLRRLFPTDFHLRTVGWVASGKRHANALEIEIGIARAVEQLYTPGGGVWILSSLIPAQGGYAPVPDNACPDDQVFLAAATIAADAVAYPPGFIDAMLGHLAAYAQKWRAEVARGSEQPLREYLAERMDFG